jgi:hypothetical protein
MTAHGVRARVRCVEVHKALGVEATYVVAKVAAHREGRQPAQIAMRHVREIVEGTPKNSRAIKNSQFGGRLARRLHGAVAET